jgi:hypothetical protein
MCARARGLNELSRQGSWPDNSGTKMRGAAGNRFSDGTGEAMFIGEPVLVKAALPGRIAVVG